MSVARFLAAAAAGAMVMAASTTPATAPAGTRNRGCGAVVGAAARVRGAARREHNHRSQ